MAETTGTRGFHTTAGETIARELLVVYLNTGNSTTPVWSPVGKRVEDSSSEMDWQTETKKDIFGNTYTTMRKPIITQTFEPCELDAGDAAQVKIWETAIKEQNVTALANMDMLLVHWYYGDTSVTGEGFAEHYPASSIEPTGLGGEGGGFIGMPINVTFGGNREIGKAEKGTGGAVTFTADT